jgi:hypothetical protein
MALERNDRNLNLGSNTRRSRAKNLGRQAVGWGAQQAVEYVKDPGMYKHITRAFAEARIAFITRWFWLAEAVTLGALVLFAVIDVLLWTDNHPVLGLLALIPVAIAFLLWRLARWLRKLLYRQIERALSAFDDALARGAAKLGDWPAFFKQWRRNERNGA